MKFAPIPKSDKEYLASLPKLDTLEISLQKRFNLITRTATRIFDTPISTLTMVDTTKERFESYQGLSVHEGKRASSFCRHALLSDTIFVVPDTKKDVRFSDSPMVKGKPYIRFYAGVPIMSDGQRVGVFCIKDTKPRKFSYDCEETLKGLALWAQVEIESRNLSLTLSNERKILEKLQVQTQLLKEIDESHKN